MHRLCQLFVLVLLLPGCGGSSPVSVAGQYHIDQDGYGFGPGADKIILTLRGNGSLDVKAGPMTLLDATWEVKDGRVTFSKGQGAIAVSYRVDGDKLIPMKDGQDVKGWRWKRN
jgi:hypothetical protein